MVRLALIAPFPQLAATARDVVQKLDVPVTVVEGALDQGAAVARRLIARQPFDVFITRGPTVTSVRAAVDVQVTDCNPTPYDLLHAMDAARPLGRKVALISFYDLEPDANKLAPILGIKLFISAVCRDLAEVRAAVAAALEAGAEVLVGGWYTVDVAREHGVPSVLLESGPETVRAAINKAQELGQIRRQEMARTRQLQAILDYASDGIVAIDQRGQVNVVNRAAARRLGMAVNEALGRPITQVAPELGLEQLLFNPQAELGVVRARGGITWAVNLVPILVDKEVSGALATFQDATQIQRLEAKIRRQLYSRGLTARFTFDDLVGSSGALREALWKARSYAQTDSTVLLIGETGTGKELVAQSIHNASPRRSGPFVAINCGALPENLLESELFGYEEGAFTGARRGGKAGLFELAHGGTIFLDEVNATSPALQARLLRVIQEREMIRLGGNSVIPLDVRIIAASNQPLSALVAGRQFRPDLYYRLNVLKLVLPPLRERSEDIPLLFARFVQRLEVNPAAADPQLSAATVAAMQAYAWPGNIRELENLAQKYVILRDRIPPERLERLLLEELTDVLPAAFPEAARHAGAAPETEPPTGPLALQELLVRYRGNHARLARELGISRTTLWKLLRRLGLTDGFGPERRGAPVGDRDLTDR